MILHMTKQNMENVLIRLPPLAEQHRIVAKVDALMALCDALESQLKEQAETQAKFANAIVKCTESE
jgi:type I restriction enzyme S subunit